MDFGPAINGNKRTITMFIVVGICNANGEFTYVN